ncbi:2Fe-2S iron-sulfur cluster-binding protein [Humisphaera borealis]|uniref:(2Fe-2S)-binding protein n=1 Tax=Humisphaera borealis TaxID=2807512 RepID=A0A7M2WX25_9BACT|nr:2Fe-2S iron-sulfur cluster-binding protein [Humisphaera borealis]QOV89060.1 (2Fe-2S)-binding protein [Humisphaera borealis]
MPKITVDGTTIDAKPGVMILQACNDAGVEIPQYCYHPGLSIVASCRICLVEVEGIPKLVPACQTPVRDGMVVFAKSSKSIANQKQVMEYLLINHPLDCPVCDQAGECLLQDYSYEYGRSQSRFEEDKQKNPKKDVGDNIFLYADRCIMCTRCVRFTREVSGTSELFVEGRGHKEEIAIFPGKPVNNKLSGNVVDLCPVGALLDKDFLFKQRVWLLKETPSISPVDAGGENIFLHHNEGVVYRIKPRYNAEVNTWWISDDTRYSYKVLADAKRLKAARKLEYGTPAEIGYGKAIEEAAEGLKSVVSADGEGSLYALLSPMMACEEAYLLGKYIRSIDPQAVLVLGPVPTAASDDVFKHYNTGKETFRIKAEKVPNANGIRRVIDLLGGPKASFDELGNYGHLRGGWIVGGYLSNWLPGDLPSVLNGGFRVIQDILPNAITDRADVVLPSAGWAEKAGCWENYAGKIQAFAAAVQPPEGARREGDVYFKLLGRSGFYDADAVRAEMGGAFADVKLPTEKEEVPAFEFAEL